MMVLFAQSLSGSEEFKIALSYLIGLQTFHGRDDSER